MAKEKYELEYLIHSSDHVLYNCMSTPSGLSGWFADDVNVHGEIFTFFWEGEERAAELLAKKKDQMVRFQWTDEAEEKTFFEIKIKIDEMTGERALIITDHADLDDMEDSRMLWDGAIEKLRRTIGS